jgi:hypothetical protein
MLMPIISMPPAGQKVCACGHAPTVWTGMQGRCIDRAANAGANAPAREAADGIARNFKCETDTTQVIGQSEEARRRPRPRPV